jgi:WD40 repeat protein
MGNSIYCGGQREGKETGDIIIPGKIQVSRMIPHASEEQGLKFVFIDEKEQIFAIACSDNKIRIFHRNSDKPIQELEGHEKPITQLIKISENRLATASDDRTIKIWNLENGECERVLEGHSESIISLAELPREHLLVSAGLDYQIRIWDLYYKEKDVKTINQSERTDCAAIVQLNSKEILCAEGNNINIYNFYESTITGTLGKFSGKILSFLISEDKGSVIVMTSAGAAGIQFMRINDGKIYREVDLLSENVTKILIFKPNLLLIANKRGMIEIMNVEKKTINTYVDDNNIRAHYVNDLVVAKDGTIIVCEPKSLQFWKLIDTASVN